jgi:2-alkyl-3-oxoalkanoate reductase
LEEEVMRVFVAGASGAIGSRLVPQLIARGHEVVGTFRTAGHGEQIRAHGGEPVELNVLDARAVREAVLAARPDAIIHEATALSAMRWSRNLDRSFALTNRIRTEGTDALLAAAREAGVSRFVAQSFASYRYAREGSWVKTEDDPLDPDPPAAARQTNAAMARLDEAVTAAGGIALRYGGFYGAGDDGFATMVRKRRYPIIGDGAGVSSWIHLDDAAAATVLALDHDGPAIYHVVDDEPAPMRDWLPVFADVLGAKRPWRAPRWVAALLAGGAMASMATQSRGASNAKAKRELGWTLRYPSWRQGFAAAYGPAAVSASARETAGAQQSGPEPTTRR